MPDVWEKVFALMADVIVESEEAFSDEEVLELRDAFHRLADRLDIEIDEGVGDID
jgi:hypothetical protein